MAASLANDPSVRSGGDALLRAWFVALAALVFVMVLVGGATRLTDSGLSITEWAPIAGFLPPFTAAQWEAEFAKYRTTTEYQTVNAGMTMAQFQFIYWWEWGHRFLGRLIGLAALLPLIGFWLAGRLPQPWRGHAIVVFLAICLQGAIGWWMVKSGLVNRVDVSQIRLAVHLTMASAIFAYLVWLARSLAPHSGAPMPHASWQGATLTLLVLLQIFLGGLVAGLDAGLAYNTWPRMDGAWVPSGLLVADPVWSNFTDNAKTVQFVHRVSAYLLWAAAIGHAVWMHMYAGGTVHARRAILLALFVTAQAAIGIVTLLLQVPVFWGLAHQGGAIVVLALAVAHWRGLTMSAAAPVRASPAMPLAHAAA